MKNLLIILLLLLAACSKPVVIDPVEKPELLTCKLDVESISAAKGGIPGAPKDKGPKPQPTPTPDPVPTPTPVPPTTGTGYACILVDFDGQDVPEGIWGAALSCLPSGLTNEQITQVLNEVTALYAPYNVFITYDENVYNAANPYKRTRVIVTPTSSWYPAGVSGVGYLGSFTWGDDTPVFVFSDRLYFLPHMIAEIVAHEAGHTFGLRHQTEYDGNCNLVSRYKNGAVMGNSLNSIQGQWIYGTTYACDAYQDDAAVIRSVL